MTLDKTPCSAVSCQSQITETKSNRVRFADHARRISHQRIGSVCVTKTLQFVCSVNQLLKRVPLFVVQQSFGSVGVFAGALSVKPCHACLLNEGQLCLHP